MFSLFDEDKDDVESLLLFLDELWRGESADTVAEVIDVALSIVATMAWICSKISSVHGIGPAKEGSEE